MSDVKDDPTINQYRGHPNSSRSKRRIQKTRCARVGLGVVVSDSASCSDGSSISPFVLEAGSANKYTMTIGCQSTLQPRARSRSISRIRWTGKPFKMRRNGVSNAIATGLLVAGILIGAVGFYGATTYQTKTVTLTETTTASLTTTATVTVAPVECSIVVKANTTLSANIGPCIGDGLIIAASGITLNCAGHEIIGIGPNLNITFPEIGTAGINLTGTSKVTVENCDVMGFVHGFWVTNSSGDTLTKNTADNNGGGFDFWANTLTKNFVNNMTLTGNTADSNYDGFYLTGSVNSTFSGNTADNNSGIGFSIAGAFDTLTNNTAVVNGIDFYLGGENDTYSANTANDSEDFGFALFNAYNSTFNGNAADGNKDDGFFLASSANNTFSGNIVDSNQGNGFEFSGSPHNILIENTVNSNGNDGFYNPGGSSRFNTLAQNTAVSNGKYGYVDDSTGSGTLGTADTYSLDKCSGNGVGGSSPSGLGTPQP